MKWGYMRLLCSLLICLKISRMHCITGQREYVTWSLKKLCFIFFLHCSFSMSCWNVLGLAFIQGDLLETLYLFKDHIQQPFLWRLLWLWSGQYELPEMIWFSGIYNPCKGTLRKELALVKLRARSKYQPFLWQMARHTCVILLNFFVSSTAAFVHALFLY